ncbi:diadenylate cyclase [Pseudomonas xanthosomatis]|uniref:diadenylate cyclase n=1 Tax=Pseudomonas xanthosomatis TaxID=2842356 RepID=UPI001C3CCF87|nr:diadenylate cyclase [Pseudomonas xanthosomatis]QXH48129.1 diadenylate cyclase [Pseudomonas xanthosomatis]
MTCKTSEFPLTLLKLISATKKKQFSGVGIVFYNDLQLLPMTALGSTATPKPHLPISQIDTIARTLTILSDLQSPWHDGFHLINSDSQALTHISQFLAPPLDHLPDNKYSRPSGARLMTAMLSSMVTGIDCIGVLNTSGEITIYQNGRVSIKVASPHE